MNALAYVAANPNDLTNQIVEFLVSIGLEVREEKVSESAFMPGIEIRGGVLVFDRLELQYPGDLLHEAGHLAIVGPDKRRRMGADAGVRIHEELAAIAWSWAALIQLRLPPDVVFHADGYKGESKALIDAFSDNRGPGIPILAWLGLCADPHAGENAVQAGLEEYPGMSLWLCQ